MKHTYRVHGLTCSRCHRRVEEIERNVEGALNELRFRSIKI